MTTYTIAYKDDLLLAVVRDGEDIDAAVAAESSKTGCDFADYGTETGLTLTNDSSIGVVIFSSQSGRSGDLLGFDYAVSVSA